MPSSTEENTTSCIWAAVPKRNICELIHRHRFRKGTTIRDIEKMALFITK